MITSPVVKKYSNYSRAPVIDKIMKLLDFAKIVSNKTEVIGYLRSKQLLPSLMECTACHKAMWEQSSSRSPDGLVFRCTQCGKTRSIRSGSIFEDSNLSLEKVLGIIYLMSLNVIERHSNEG
jgi:hypothetical protein